MSRVVIVSILPKRPEFIHAFILDSQLTTKSRPRNEDSTWPSGRPAPTARESLSLSLCWSAGCGWVYGSRDEEDGLCAGVGGFLRWARKGRRVWCDPVINLQILPLTLNQPIILPTNQVHSPRGQMCWRVQFVVGPSAKAISAWLMCVKKSGGVRFCGWGQFGRSGEADRSDQRSYMDTLDRCCRCSARSFCGPSHSLSFLTASDLGPSLYKSRSASRRTDLSLRLTRSLTTNKTRSLSLFFSLTYPRNSPICYFLAFWNFCIFQAQRNF